jgi:hypothetical protein
MLPNKSDACCSSRASRSSAFICTFMLERNASAPSCLNVMFTLTFVFTNAHDARYACYEMPDGKVLGDRVTAEYVE